jgi:hypothetical protein
MIAKGKKFAQKKRFPPTHPNMLKDSLSQIVIAIRQTIRTPRNTSSEGFSDA